MMIYVLDVMEKAEVENKEIKGWKLFFNATMLFISGWLMFPVIYAIILAEHTFNGK